MKQDLYTLSVNYKKEHDYYKQKIVKYKKDIHNLEKQNQELSSKKSPEKRQKPEEKRQKFSYFPQYEPHKLITLQTEIVCLED